MTNLNNQPIRDGKPFFMGDEALIKFSNGEEGLDKGTFWLVNKEDHTIRPFESPMALDTVFGKDLEEALNNVAIVSQPTINDNGDITEGVLTGFSILGPEYMIKDNGSAKELHFSNYQLENRYGKKINVDEETKAAGTIKQFIGLLKENEDKTGIPSSFLDKIENDDRLMAFYVSSLAYGKYTLKDVYADIDHLFKTSKE